MKHFLTEYCQELINTPEFKSRRQRELREGVRPIPAGLRLRQGRNSQLYKPVGCDACGGTRLQGPGRPARTAGGHRPHEEADPGACPRGRDARGGAGRGHAHPARWTAWRRCCRASPTWRRCGRSASSERARDNGKGARRGGAGRNGHLPVQGRNRARPRPRCAVPLQAGVPQRHRHRALPGARHQRAARDHPASPRRIITRADGGTLYRLEERHKRCSSRSCAPTVARSRWAAPPATRFRSTRSPCTTRTASPTSTMVAAYAALTRQDREHRRRLHRGGLRLLRHAQLRQEAPDTARPPSSRCR